MTPKYRTNDFNPPIPFLTGDAAVLHSIITEMDRVSSMDPVSIVRHQESLLGPLIEHFSKVDLRFRDRLQGDLCDNFSLSKLRLIEPKAKPYFQSISADKNKGSNNVPRHHLPTHWAETSGSTGVPLRIKNTAISRAISLAQMPWTHLQAGTDFSWKLASVKPTNQKVKLSSSWDGATDLLFEVGQMLSISSSEDVFSQLDYLEGFGPDMLIVFPSVLNEYVQLWKDGVRPALSLKVIRTMGETLREETRALASELTGAVILDTYSSSEVGRIATQIEDGGNYLVNNYSLIVEVLREDGSLCQPGEIGKVVITDLSNYATPMIRYETGDYAVPGDSCHHTLQSIKGRSRNMITLPNGSKVWPLVGYREFSKVVPIRQFHVRQTGLDQLVATFHVDQVPTGHQKDQICAIIQESLGGGFVIEANFQVEPLKKGVNQKLEDFVSLVV